MQTTYVRSATESRREVNEEAGGGAAAASSAPHTEPAPVRPARARTSAFKAPGPAGPNSDRALVEALGNSKVFQDYEQAFTEATGLPVALRAVESWQLPHHGKRNESPFCALVLENSRACASCLQVQEKLAEAAAEEPHTVGCPAGLCDTAVPVRLGDRLIGFLQTGQVFRKQPTQAQFERTCRLVAAMGRARGSGQS